MNPLDRLRTRWREATRRAVEPLIRSLRDDLRGELRRVSQEHTRRLRELSRQLVIAGQVDPRTTDAQGFPRPIQAYPADKAFHATYERGLTRVGTKDRGQRRERFYNLVQLFRHTGGVEGALAECGCWRGLSAFLLCEAARAERGAFSGEGLHLVDSFQGLPEPGVEDQVDIDVVVQGVQRRGRPFKGAGGYAATREQVAEVLGDYPGVRFHPGWIPEVLAELPEQRYRFVHVDVDLFAATRACFEYFQPRLAPGGVLVCDDYGSLLWPGARQAVDAFAAERGLHPLVLSTGQAVLFGR